MHGANVTARCRTSTEVFDELPQRQAESFFDEAAMLDIACELKCKRAPRPIDAKRRIFITARNENIGYGSQAYDVVDNGRVAEQALERGQGWLVSDDACFALEALQHCRLFTTDIRTCANVQIDLEVKTTILDVFAKPARILRRL